VGKIKVAIFWNPIKNKTQFCLLEDYKFYYGSFDVITIEAGYVTDFASVPKWLWSLLPPIGKHNEAALVHDYLYDNKIGKRKDADWFFYWTMEEDGVSFFTRWAMFLGVRLFAKSWWDN
jgi:hypothetical protein